MFLYQIYFLYFISFLSVLFVDLDMWKIKMKSSIKKIIILIIIITGIILLIKLTPLGNLLHLDDLYNRKDELLAAVKSNFILSSAVFVFSYITVAALSIPGAAFLSILGGFFFGPFAGTVLINIGATTGAYIIFLAARFFLGSSIQNKYSAQLAKFNTEIENNGTNYLLTLRFIPVFPFFLINLLSGFTKIPSSTFLWTTAAGIIPGSFVYSYIGYAGASIEGEDVFGPEIITAMVLLALLSILPVIIKKLKKRNTE